MNQLEQKLVKTLSQNKFPQSNIRLTGQINEADLDAYDSGEV